MNDSRDRRHDPRVPLQRPVKLQCQITGRFFAGQTVNLSAGGSLMQLGRASLMVPGQRVRVAIPADPRAALLRSADFVEATVLRALGMGGRQSVALRFDQPQALPALAVSA